MENKKQNKNGYKIAFWSIMFCIIIFLEIFSIYWISAENYNNGYKDGYSNGTFYIVNGITQTGVVPYFINKSGNLTVQYLDLRGENSK